MLPRGHPLAGSASINLAALAALPFISYPKDPQTTFASQVLAMLGAAGAKPNVVYEAIEIQTAFGLVAAGLGVTLTGASVTEHNRTDVVFVPLSDLSTQTAVVAVSRADENSKLVESFLATLLPPAPAKRPRARRAAR